MIRRAIVGAAIVAMAGCSTQTSDGGGSRGLISGAGEKVSSLTTPQGEKTPLIAQLKPGPYTASSLAVGEEKDIAQHRAEGLGLVRVAAVEQHLGDVRERLVTASGVTGVPGRVVILANPSFAAYSVPDGNIYVSMGWLEYLESADEVAALLAHELSHVLLKHHSADLVAATHRRAQALYELGISAKSAFTASGRVSKGDARELERQQLIGDVADKVALPAWSRRQEREADLLGVDLLRRAGYDAAAMVSVLEKLQAWEKRNKEPEDAFWDRLSATAQKDPGAALKLGYQRAVDSVSAGHPKTDERLDDVAEYLERHYGSASRQAVGIGPWKAVATRPEVSQVMRNYDMAFSAKKLFDKGKTQEAYALAKASATGRTATDAYPNWILARTASALGHQREAVDALRRAISAAEPVPEIYDSLIASYEQAGNLGTALEWTDKASATFGGAPRWIPVKIRLLRKAGRTAEASSLTLSCSVNTPDWRKLCQQANETPAGRLRG